MEHYNRSRIDSPSSRIYCHRFAINTTRAVRLLHLACSLDYRRIPLLENEAVSQIDASKIKTDDRIGNYRSRWFSENPGELQVKFQLRVVFD